MDDRTKTICSFILLAATVGFSGCGFNQQSRFQMSFLPSAPHATVVEAEALPPAPPPNPYIQQTPAFFITHAAPLPARKTSGDALMLRAEQTFQRGKRSCQANDISTARRHFD